MGRGRAKAKQTRVARDLKYSSPNTDLERLQRELSIPSRPSDATPDGGKPDDDSDEWAGYSDPDEDSWASSAR
ncbi:MAG: DUF3073 domain-containing protein [Geodermatophilaceae bacterium]|jgi:hypothetical protein|nr:DUF3073 domain-containing protein [Geodermatophilaceae bacterium]